MNTYKIIDYLIANPFSKETDFNGKLDETSFFGDYFIESDSYKEMNMKFNSIFEASSNQLPLSIFLYGYSGTGKTTYLRWYLKKFIKNYNVVFFDFANTIESKDAKEKDGTIKIFDKYFQSKLLKLFHEDNKSISDLLTTIYVKLFEIDEVFSKDFVRSLHSLMKSKNSVEIERFEYFEFIISLSYQDLLLLLLISYYEYPVLFSKLFKNQNLDQLPLLIVLDNIDHIDIEYHNSHFPKEIEKTYFNLKSYYNGRSKYPISIHFIFSLRDANCTLINRQIADISPRKAIFFKPLNNTNEIIRRRIELAIKNSINLSEDQKEFLEFVFRDEYSRKSFQPLFNFNIRKFAEFFSSLIHQFNEVYIGQIKSLSKNRDTLNGSRGIIFFLLLKHLLSYEFLNKRIFLDDGNQVGSSDGGNVNPTRILLTNLHNLSMFSMDSFTKTTHVTPIGLYTLNKYYSEIFKNHDDQFFNILSDLFLFHKVNWCHLITFTNKQVFSNNNFTHEKHLLGLAKGKQDEESINELNEIKVQINPSGFIYLRDIIKHYEFFSIRAGNTKPLFNSLEFKIKEDKFIPEFLENIDKTFQITEKCVESLNKFINANIIPDFEKTVHCFRLYTLDDDFTEDYYEDQPGRLYIVRIIDTHIRYLDTFRCYILNHCETYKKFYENPDNLINYRNLFVKINKDLIFRIEQYIELLKKSKGIRVDNLSKIFGKNIDSIKTDYNSYISINTGRS